MRVDILTNPTQPSGEKSAKTSESLLDIPCFNETATINAFSLSALIIICSFIAIITKVELLYSLVQYWELSI